MANRNAFINLARDYTGDAYPAYSAARKMPANFQRRVAQQILNQRSAQLADPTDAQVGQMIDEWNREMAPKAAAAAAAGVKLDPDDVMDAAGPGTQGPAVPPAGTAPSPAGDAAAANNFLKGFNKRVSVRTEGKTLPMPPGKTPKRYIQGMGDEALLVDDWVALYQNAGEILNMARDPKADFVDIGRIIDTIGALGPQIPGGENTKMGRDMLNEARKLAVARLRTQYRDAQPKPVKGKFGTETLAGGKKKQVESGTEDGIKKYGATARQANALQYQQRLEDGYQGDGAYWGNLAGSTLAGKIPVIGKYIAPFAGQAGSAAEDWLIDKGLNKLSGVLDGVSRYMGQGRYVSEDDPANAYYDEPIGKRRRADYDPDDLPTHAPNLALPSIQSLYGRELKGVGGGPRMMENQLVNPQLPSSSKAPVMMSSLDETGDLIFTYREYLQDITPTTAEFQTQVLVNVNPGLKDSFPLLSQFGGLFSEYRFEKLLYTFKSLVTDGNATAGGSIMLGFQYNPTTAGFADKRAMTDSSDAVNGRVNDNLVMGVECKEDQRALGGYLYVRQGDVGGQLNTYDVGRIQVATIGATPGQDIGELWVEYRVRLSKLAIAGMRPLSLGDGIALSRGTPGGYARTAWFARTWLGTEYTTGTPIVKAQFPLAKWKALPTLQPGAFPAVDTAKLIGTLAQNPGVFNIMDSATTAIDSGTFLINGYSMTPDIQYSFIDTTTDPTLVMVFNALANAQYTFQFSIQGHGTLTGSTTTPTIANLAYPFTEPTLGKFTATIESGSVYFANNLTNPCDLVLGSACYSATQGLGVDSLCSNNWSTGCKLICTGQGQVRFRLKLHTASFSLDGGQLTAQNCSWSFTRTA